MYGGADLQDDLDKRKQLVQAIGRIQRVPDPTNARLLSLLHEQGGQALVDKTVADWNLQPDGRHGPGFFMEPNIVAKSNENLMRYFCSQSGEALYNRLDIREDLPITVNVEDDKDGKEGDEKRWPAFCADEMVSWKVEKIVDQRISLRLSWTDPKDPEADPCILTTSTMRHKCKPFKISVVTDPECEVLSCESTDVPEHTLDLSLKQILDGAIMIQIKCGSLPGHIKCPLEDLPTQLHATTAELSEDEKRWSSFCAEAKVTWKIEDPAEDRKDLKVLATLSWSNPCKILKTSAMKLKCKPFMISVLSDVSKEVLSHDKTDVPEHTLKLSLIESDSISLKHIFDGDIMIQIKCGSLPGHIKCPLEDLKTHFQPMCTEPMCIDLTEPTELEPIRGCGEVDGRVGGRLSGLDINGGGVSGRLDEQEGVDELGLTLAERREALKAEAQLLKVCLCARACVRTFVCMSVCMCMCV